MDSEPMCVDGAAAEAASEEAPPLAEKRVTENGDAEARPRKKPRIGGGMKRVAEIVLVLATTARVRAGKKPTEAEIGLMAEAREKLVELCEGLAPRDIASKEAIGAVIDDLGLNARAKEQKLGFRGPKLTIAEKFSQWKKKAEDSKKFPAQSSPFTSQPFQPSFNTAPENRVTSHALKMTVSDKQSHPQMPSMSASLPSGHVPTAISTSLPYQLQTNDVKPSFGSTSFPSTTNLGRDMSSSALPRVDRTLLKLDGGPSGPSYASQGQVNSSSLHQLVNAPTWSLQAQAAKSGPEQVKQPNLTATKVDVNSQISIPRVTPPAPFVTQSAPGNFPSVHQPLQPANVSQVAPLTSSHNEIAKIVQKLLQPKLPDHPTWIPPSRDYMNKALTCQICHHIINDVDSVLICDACEKGYHTKCAQSSNSNQRGIPRGEWHCSRCLAVSGGKPLPPKYGRVMRSNTPLKVPSTAAGFQSLSEKKVGVSNPKFSQQNIATNVSSEKKVPAQSGSVPMNSNKGDLAADLKSRNVNDTQNSNLHVNDTQRSILSLDSKSVDEKPVLGSGANSSMKSSEAVSASSAIDSSESSSQVMNNSESQTAQEESIELKPPPLNPVLETVDIDNKAESSQPCNEVPVVDQSEMPKSPEDASKKSEDSNVMTKEPDKSHLNEGIDCKTSDVKRDEQDSDQANAVGSSAMGSGVTEHSGNSSADPFTIEWIGNVIQVVHEKSFYQTCRVGGVSYQLQDHVLLQSFQGKLIPSKIQSMWEDTETGSKWVNTSRYIFPSDLPENVGRPCSTDSNEVYESRQEIAVMAEYIKGPCEVLPPSKYEEESERRKQLVPEPNNGLRPIYICKWLYDEVKGSFQPVSG